MKAINASHPQVTNPEHKETRRAMKFLLPLLPFIAFSFPQSAEEVAMGRLVEAVSAISDNVDKTLGDLELLLSGIALSGQFIEVHSLDIKTSGDVECTKLFVGNFYTGSIVQDMNGVAASLMGGSTFSISSTSGTAQLLPPQSQPSVKRSSEESIIP